MDNIKVNKRIFGALGEKIAAEYLSENGYKILCCNYRAGRLGEIDIIAKNNEYICFVEVKTRSNTNFGMPSEAVNHKKRETIRKIAWTYLKQYKLHESCIRFDIVEILGEKKNSSFEPKNINLIKNAF